jgi:large subunit ribosomal protein L17
MRHGKSFNHLSRTSAHRKALLANLASSLIMHKRIKTTTAKAKALRSFIEPIITRSKEDSTHSRRLAFSYLGNKYAVSELFREVSLKIGDRPGGYTRILKIDNRHGDNADMCIIELVDYNENLLGEKAAAKTKTARRRRGKRKPGEPKAVAEAEVTTAEREIGQDETPETIDEQTSETEEEAKSVKAKTQKTPDSKVEKEKQDGDSETGKAKEE